MLWIIATFGWALVVFWFFFYWFFGHNTTAPKTITIVSQPVKKFPHKEDAKEDLQGKRRFVRDVLYGYIELSDAARAIIDTPEFQSLRDLKQLGLGCYVFPSANHTRFEHSIGVYELVGQALKHLFERQPQIFPPNPKRFIELVKIAGLCHDLGHMAFSHTFDDQVAKTLGLPAHEERGALMLKQMNKFLKLFCDEELEFVVGLMLGSTTAQTNDWVSGFICNQETALDFDKIDYLMRDSYYIGLSQPIQFDRLLLHMKVLTVGQTMKVCFHRKVLLQICDIFQTRFRLFREVYRHRVVVDLDVMMGDLMRLTKPLLLEIMKTQRITDSIFPMLPYLLIHTNTMTDNQKNEARVLWNRMQTRKLYKLRETTNTKEADIQVKFGLSALETDPIEQIWFYDTPHNNVSKIRVSDVTKMWGNGPRVTSETRAFCIDK